MLNIGSYSRTSALKTVRPQFGQILVDTCQRTGIESGNIALELNNNVTMDERAFRDICLSNGFFSLAWKLNHQFSAPTSAPYYQVSTDGRHNVTDISKLDRYLKLVKQAPFTQPIKDELIKVITGAKALVSLPKLAPLPPFSSENG